MDVIYGLIPMMLFFGFLVVVVFIWMAKKGYFDDMDGQASRILMDDDDFEPTTSQRSKHDSGDELVDKSDSVEKADAAK
ncbi:cbb3-type cytochrome oxidase assembly protein CcoS [Thiomicrorhabdus heinhorstiae]|uniref:Cbb3-type cytochrome oxidase assembly protein CcoS n=1 Tax=Thiomicrorhabdus heinhorstiae TaxID=2748010 RepID=A0ABS0BUE5_9GAMM|nr:cbb3-type cytochrome oxidase assembly protein CcoS [Thiomicrorhabdus heinhorstiae]MBF6057465.1 cbb3-type cytochrome oxidase assembly protein CcoS [Thiomicrorhabdus heinhorstiae]